jgi:superfamily II DNA or RNA helicase/diadenosine tetraphosphate (Ap4A) HIT family hydrolase
MSSVLCDDAAVTDDPTRAESPFLARPHSDWIASNSLAFAIWDGFPVSPGHALLIPKRAVATWFDATVEEQHALMDLVAPVRAIIEDRFRDPAPAGWNIGINVGAAGGQTVFHLHMHVIPRYAGDMEDPRGGVRHVIPWKGNYKRAAPARLATGGDHDPFLAHLRPHFATATDIAIIAAFVQDSGLDHLELPVLEALARGARIRVLTGDYLDITQAAALRRLLQWQDHGAFGARIHRVAEQRAFHPKSWRFESPGSAHAFVGSSNISASALRRGIEWNMVLGRDEDPNGYAEIATAFEEAWNAAQPLTSEFIENYARRARAREALHPATPPGEIDAPAAPPEPHVIQREALAALREIRADGGRRAVVVLATGLGKTWLAAFDIADMARKRPAHVPHVLFVAHRDEILQQSADTLRRALLPHFPTITFGMCAGAADTTDTDVVLASVQKACREPWLERLTKRHFDYVVIDEVHHADAPSYRRLITRLDPGFLLGLTATPERTDGADILSLFDDNIATVARLDRGIREGLLVPFHYVGLRDAIDYRPIPWRNRRFDPDLLAAALETETRMQRLWQALRDHPGTRTLFFCASRRHAIHVTTWLHQKGFRIVAVDGETPAAGRADALRRLQRGQLDGIAAVDLFNEGLDLPGIDRVVMLRPTDSPVVFLQQLGRGLRVARGKHALTIIDFVGNHRIFLERLAFLLAGDKATPASALRQWLDERDAILPPGCRVDIDLDVIAFLKEAFPDGRDVLQRAYREQRLLLERRPEAAEMYRLGLDLTPLRQHGGWFAFVANEGDLADDERQTLEIFGDFLTQLETTAMVKCFKMVVLDVMLAHESLWTGMPVGALARASLAWLLRSPGLMADIANVRTLGDPHRIPEGRWLTYWRSNPIDAWCNGPWFGVESRSDGRGRAADYFVFKPPSELADTLRPACETMIRELVALRLAQYRARRGRPTEAATTDRTRPLVLQRVPLLRDLAAAAGLASGAELESVAQEPLDVRFDQPIGPETFAIRVTGNSMDGGKSPIRDGDIVLVSPARGLDVLALKDRVVLVQRSLANDSDTAGSLHLKRLRLRRGRWRFESDHPDGPSWMRSPADTVVAVFVARIDSADVATLAPRAGD